MDSAYKVSQSNLIRCNYPIRSGLFAVLAVLSGLYITFTWVEYFTEQKVALVMIVLSLFVLTSRLCVCKRRRMALTITVVFISLVGILVFVSLLRKPRVFQFAVGAVPQLCCKSFDCFRQARNFPV